MILYVLIGIGLGFLLASLRRLRGASGPMELPIEVGLVLVPTMDMYLLGSIGQFAPAPSLMVLMVLLAASLVLAFTAAVMPGGKDEDLVLASSAPMVYVLVLYILALVTNHTAIFWW